MPRVFVALAALAADRPRGLAGGGGGRLVHLHVARGCDDDRPEHRRARRDDLQLVVDTVNGNIAVGNNAAIDITVTTVNGNVRVGSSSAAQVIVGTVNGNFSARAGSSVSFIGSTLNGNYSAFNASSGLLDTSFARNVSITGGSYTIIVNTIGKNLSCDGGASGIAAANTIGGHTTGCAVI
jgi:hypothetical protein